MKSFIIWTKRHKILTFSLIIASVILVSLTLRSRHSQLGPLSAPLHRGPIIESVYGIGTVTATKSYSLKFGVHTTIKKLYVREGDHVEADQKLVDMLDGNSLKAPFAGTITALPYRVGENVLAQSIVLNLVDLQDRYIVVSLEQRSALLVHPGQRAKLSFDGLRKISYDGLVESMYSNDNNFLVRIDASNLPQQILPGMTADVAIAIAPPRDVLLAPVAAIEDGKVYLQQAHGIKTVEVKTGIVDGAEAEVISNELHEGDRLMIRMKS